MPISTLGMICLACVSMSEAPANITGLSAKAPAMIQLAANYEQKFYNITKSTWGDWAEVSPRPGHPIRLLPLSERQNRTTATYKYWNDLIISLNSTWNEWNLDGEGAQKKRRVEALKWYMWKVSHIPADSAVRLNHFEKSAKMNEREHGKWKDDPYLLSILAKLPHVKKGHRSSKI
jgi:hypothetical protein